MKFKKLMALVLSSSMMLSLIPKTAYTAPSFGLGSGSNGIVMSGSWLPKVDGFDVSVDNELQALRISLIKVGNSESAPDGMPYIDDKIVQNPIQVYNENNNRVRSTNEELELRFIVNEDIKSRTASRRELTGWNRSNTDLTKAPMMYGCHWDKNSNAWVADSGDNFIKTAVLYNYIFSDPAVPDFCGSLKSSYQESSKATSLGHPEWASMSNQDYFLSYTRSAFYVEEAGKVVPDFAYRMIAKMLNKANTPYCDEVEQFYNEHILTGELVFLVEPMMFLKNTPESYTEEVFGSAELKPYIGLTCGEIGFLDDSYSSVNYGYTDLGNLNSGSSSDGNPNNYNYLTAPNSSSAKACMDLYKSTTLKSNELNLGLYSPLGAVSAGGLKDQTKTNINIGNNSNLTEITNTEDNYGALFGSGTTNEEHLGAAFLTCVYKQVYNNVANGGGTTVGYTDPYAIMNVGGMMIVRPVYSTVDFKAESLSVSQDPQATSKAEAISSINVPNKGTVPIYDRNVIYQDENGNNFVNVQAKSKLNFIQEDVNDINSMTNWGDKVTQNKASLLSSTSEDVKKIDGSFDLSKPVYIPAFTKTQVNVQYANQQGVSEGKAIELIPNDRTSALFIENKHEYGYYANNPPDSKALDITVSVANHSKPTSDELGSPTPDGKYDIHGEFPCNNTVPKIDGLNNEIKLQDIGSEAGGNYVKILLPKNLDMTKSYLQINLDVNIGKLEDTAYSRPQDSLHATGSKDYRDNKPCILSNAEDKNNPIQISDCVEKYYKNNTLTILIKLDQSLDLSADSISRTSAPIITKSPTTLNQCNIKTQATADEGVQKSYPTQKATQKLFYYFSTENTNYFRDIYNEFANTVAADWTDFNDTIGPMVNHFNKKLNELKGNTQTVTTSVKSVTETGPDGTKKGIDPMDIPNTENTSWECIKLLNIDTNYTGPIYLHMALVVNPDNSIPNEDTYRNNVTFESFTYDIPPEDPPLPPSSSLSCYVPTGSSSGLPLRILNNSTPTNYVNGILNQKILEVNKDKKNTAVRPGKEYVDGSVDSRYGARIRVDNVPNTSALGYRPDPQYEEAASIVVGRCNGKNEKEEPEDTPKWVFYKPNDLIFHEIAFKYLSYDSQSKKYYIATQIIPYTKREIEYTPCDCEDGCSAATVTYHYYRLCDTQTVDYTLIFDDLYTQDGNASSAYSLESLLNNTGDEQGKYYYIATNGSLVGLTMRTRLISDYPNFSGNTTPSSGAGVPLDGIVQLADSRGAFNTNSNIKAELEVTDFEYIPHILNDYNGTEGPSLRAKAVQKSNDAYRIILLPPDYTSNLTSRPTTLDTSPKLNRDENALYGKNLDGTNTSGTWQYTTYTDIPQYTQDFINVRYYRFDIKPNTSTWNGKPYSTRGQRGIITDPNQADSVKINRDGIPEISNKDIIQKKMNTSPGHPSPVADAIDRYAYGYVGTRLKPVIYANNLYQPNGLNPYTYTTMSGSTQETSYTSLLGLCGDFNIVTLDTTYNQYTLN